MNKKYNNILREYFSTNVIDGNRFLFLIIFWLTKLSNVSLRSGGAISNPFRAFWQRIPTTNFIIQNNEGIFQVTGGNDSLTIVSSYFEKSQKTWLGYPEKRRIFIDIGANRGIYSILATSRYNYQKAIAFEPQSTMVDELLNNAKYNNLSDQIHVFEFALGSASGISTLFVDTFHRGGARLDSGISSDDQITVKVETLDKLLSKSEKKQVGFIKIDTEGHEIDVIKGMMETLESMENGSFLMIESTQIDNLKIMLLEYRIYHIKSIGYDHLFKKE